ncbi:MAG: MarR family winged helix-turn-helix transcriptional regulator [Vicinamibacteria bacterium]
MTKTPFPKLSEMEGSAWAGFLRAHDLVTQRLDAELRASNDLALIEFEILLHLARAGGEKRMAQIAHDVVLTGGGVTRIVARLEKLGYLTRRSCPKDGRGIFAVLTDAGWAKQRAAHTVHVEGVKRLFLQNAKHDELAVLSAFFDRIVSRVRAKEQSRDDACALDKPTTKRGGKFPQTG